MALSGVTFAHESAHPCPLENVSKNSLNNKMATIYSVRYPDHGLATNYNLNLVRHYKCPGNNVCKWIFHHCQNTENEFVLESRKYTENFLYANILNEMSHIGKKQPEEACNIEKFVWKIYYDKCSSNYYLQNKFYGDWVDASGNYRMKHTGCSINPFDGWDSCGKWRRFRFEALGSIEPEPQAIISNTPVKNTGVCPLSEVKKSKLHDKTATVYSVRYNRNGLQPQTALNLIKHKPCSGKGSCKWNFQHCPGTSNVFVLKNVRNTNNYLFANIINAVSHFDISNENEACNDDRLQWRIYFDACSSNYYFQNVKYGDWLDANHIDNSVKHSGCRVNPFNGWDSCGNWRRWRFESLK